MRATALVVMSVVLFVGAGMLNAEVISPISLNNPSFEQDPVFNYNFTPAGWSGTAWVVTEKNSYVEADGMGAYGRFGQDGDKIAFLREYSSPIWQTASTPAVAGEEYVLIVGVSSGYYKAAGEYSVTLKINDVIINTVSGIAPEGKIMSDVVVRGIAPADGNIQVVLGSNATYAASFDNVRLGQVVPEPATMALLGMGSVIGLLRRRKA